MPRKAEHLSSQGKKDFENRSMGYGVISLFVQLLQFCPCGDVFSHNSHVSEPISKILFSSESLA